MDTVIDLDLDFFVNPTAIWPQWEGRAPESDYTAATVDAVREFLEQQCGVDRQRRLPGVQFEEHVEAFWTWKRWIAEGKLTTPFRVIHIDAHADIGLGDAGWVYLLTEILELPVDKRNVPRASGDSRDMNSGNYLAFAVANRWIPAALAS
jgi:hypothetical protein